MNKEIMNVYEFKTKNNTKSYIYSLEKKEEDLNFKYYILTKDDNLESTIYEANNTLNMLQLNNIQLIPIEKNSPSYQKFLEELQETLEKITNQKKAIPNR